MLAAIAKRDDRTIVENARKWLDDEPFSTNPAMAGSFYCAAHLGDHDAAIAFADRGLHANPGDRMLLNNKLVSLASANKLSEAHQILPPLAKHATDPTFRSHYLAANGIIAFREGRTNEGRGYYLDAISIAREQGDPVRAFIAYAYWLEQETYIGIHDLDFFHKVSRQLDSQAQKLPSRDREQINFTWNAMRRRLLTALAQQAIPHIVPPEQDPRVPNLGRSPQISHSTTQLSGRGWRGW